MRRIRPSSPPGLLREDPPRELNPRRPALDAELELSTITPIVGGGVESFEPDVVDIVRVPGIRGQLRWWWRALFAAEESSTAELFGREASLWGGVGVRFPRETEDRALPSRVRIAVELLDPGKVVPAGYHERVGDRVKAFPRWAIGSRLAYALFPLQVPHDDRKSAGRSAAVPTKSVRIGVRFRVRLIVGPDHGESPEGGPAPPEQALAALWAWTFFGGLGARTRRGFGAVTPSKAITLSGLPDERERVWTRRFERPGASPGQVAGWLREAVADLSPAPSGTFATGQLLLGRKPIEGHPGPAHERLVDLLGTFRQGVGVARDGGNRRPGQSFWPEAHLVRSLWRKHDPGHTFDHPPPHMPEEAGAPRAAFGLPIQIHFKDPRDRAADATIAPALKDGDRDGNGEGEGRWASPVLLRPLAVHGETGEAYVPAILILGGRTIPKARVVFGKGEKREVDEVSVQSEVGARPPIGSLLRASGGDAVKAFAAWLEHEHEFEELPVMALRKGSDA